MTTTSLTSGGPSSKLSLQSPALQAAIEFVAQLQGQELSWQALDDLWRDFLVPRVREGLLQTTCFLHDPRGHSGCEAFYAGLEQSGWQDRFYCLGGRWTCTECETENEPSTPEESTACAHCGAVRAGEGWQPRQAWNEAVAISLAGVTGAFRKLNTDLTGNWTARIADMLQAQGIIARPVMRGFDDYFQYGKALRSWFMEQGIADYDADGSLKFPDTLYTMVQFVVYGEDGCRWLNRPDIWNHWQELSYNDLRQWAGHCRIAVQLWWQKHEAVDATAVAAEVVEQGGTKAEEHRAIRQALTEGRTRENPLQEERVTRGRRIELTIEQIEMLGWTWMHVPADGSPSQAIVIPTPDTATLVDVVTRGIAVEDQ